MKSFAVLLACLVLFVASALARPVGESTKADEELSALEKVYHGQCRKYVCCCSSYKKDERTNTQLQVVFPVPYDKCYNFLDEVICEE
ncbi:hypothetical protein MP228_007937 [Amoeboaphelidium protococcarum]|nr:hypothetical protein MP228_007937 [Amoeboaphelidium protococcarum]